MVSGRASLACMSRIHSLSLSADEFNVTSGNCTPTGNTVCAPASFVAPGKRDGAPLSEYGPAHHSFLFLSRKLPSLCDGSARQGKHDTGQEDAMKHCSKDQHCFRRAENHAA